MKRAQIPHTFSVSHHFYNSTGWNFALTQSPRTFSTFHHHTELQQPGSNHTLGMYMELAHVYVNRLVKTLPQPQLIYALINCTFDINIKTNKKTSANVNFHYMILQIVKCKYLKKNYHHNTFCRDSLQIKMQILNFLRF